ncbi:MAG: lamin tail domain-containing protein [Flavobacteriales bacterium]|jgi:hypothetical protein|nr:lamin tail domain-containing protein [Flavobacteriales bacterium]
MKFTFLAVSVVLMMVSCSEIRSTPRNSKMSSNDESVKVSAQEYENTLVINEYCVKNRSENGEKKKADWFEIYNSSDRDITLNSGEWSVTDDLDKPEKFYLPEMTIESKGYIVIWCDGKDKITDKVHTNFKLNASGESIGIFYMGELVDAVTYEAALTENVSYGRIQDGSEEWTTFEIASIGYSN